MDDVVAQVVAIVMIVVMTVLMRLLMRVVVLEVSGLSVVVLTVFVTVTVPGLSAGQRNGTRAMTVPGSLGVAQNLMQMPMGPDERDGVLMRTLPVQRERRCE